MILRFSFHVTYDDGQTVDVVTNGRDQRDFEEHFATSIVDLVPKSMLDKAMAANGAPVALDGADARVQTNRFMWLAHRALTRTGAGPGTYDEFCDRLAGLGCKGIEQAVPTLPAPRLAS